MAEKREEGEKDPFEEVLSQLEQIVQFAKKNAGIPVSIDRIPLDFEEKLSQFEKNLEKFRLESEKMAAGYGIEETAIHRTIEQIPEDLPKQSQKTLKKLGELKKDAEEALEKVKTAENIKAKEKGQKKFPKAARKNKFRQLGDDKWQKM